MPHIPLVAEVAAALREHKAVREAVAYSMPGPEGAVAAFVLADAAYLDQVLKRNELGCAKVRKWRKAYDLSQLAKPAGEMDFAFNIAGWNSSYTRLPIPPEDMREWVQATVDRISSLGPREVLEIGCGTGLLLLRLAPLCQRYVGTDISPAVLTRVREQLMQGEGLRERVELLERSAENFEGFTENSFDTVVINSVAQYFPTQTYLDRVVENAIRVVRPGGHIFIGDNRNLVLHRAFALSVEAFQAQPELSVAELRARVDRRVQQEQELLSSPSYFLALAARFPKISRVEILLRRGIRDNEMTRFRFDAKLWVGGGAAPGEEIPFLAPPAGGWNDREMRRLLASGEAVGFSRIANLRVNEEVKLLARLESAQAEQTLGELRKEVAQAETGGIHPEEIARLAGETGYEVAMSWAGCYPDGSYDAAFIRQPAPGESFFPAVRWPKTDPARFVYYTNAPGEAGIRDRLIHEVLIHCRVKLTEALIPKSCYLVDSFPRRSDGMVDSDALLRATQGLDRVHPI